MTDHKDIPAKPYPPMEDECWHHTAEVEKDWTVWFAAIAVSIFIFGILIGVIIERERGCKNTKTAAIVELAPQSK